MRVTGPGGIDVKRTLTFDVKVPAGDIRRMSVATLAPRGGKISLSRDLVQDLIPRRTNVTVTVGPQGALDVPGLLASLDRYPYGCAEQTTSRALPLLYVNDVAKRIGLASDTQVRERIDGAIARVLEMQDSSGAFGIWGPSDGDMWLTSYVTDFLTRAKEANYTVRKQALDQALDRLANYISYAQDFERGGEARAYALYVLARNGRAPIGELRYYVDTKLDDFGTPLAQAQLGAALAMMGDRPRAERALQAAFKGVTGKDDGDSRRDYGTSMRDGAALITLASETGVAKADVPRMIELVAKAYASKTYTSTQEQAWMVLAARSLADEAKSMTLTVNGQAHQGQLIRGLTAAELQGGSVTIANTGDAPAGAVVSVIGAALTPEPAISKGFTVERTLLCDGRQEDRSQERHRRHRPAQAERAHGGGAEGGRHRDRRPHPAGGSPAGGPGDREPAAGRLRRHQEPRLAQDHAGAAAHPVPRRPFRRRLRLLRQLGRAPGPARRGREWREPGSGLDRHGGLHRARRDAGLLRAPGRHGGGHVPPRPVRPHGGRPAGHHGQGVRPAMQRRDNATTRGLITGRAAGYFFLVFLAVSALLLRLMSWPCAFL